MLPRLRPLAPRSQAAIMSLGLALFAAVPPFFVYLKAPPRFHSDVLAVGKESPPVINNLQNGDILFMVWNIQLTHIILYVLVSKEFRRIVDVEA